MGNTLASIGLDVEAIVARAAKAGPQVALDLARRVESLLRGLEGERGTVTVEAKLPRSIEGVAGRHGRAVGEAAEALSTGKISQAEFNKRMHDSITENFREAYGIGRGKALDAGDDLWLERAVEAEMEHARKFGQDIVDKTGRMPVRRRAAMYGQTIEGIAWNGRVESMPDKARIYWKLGCLTSNSVDIITARGKIPLARVCVGDLVLTHRGRWRRVIAKPVKRSTVHHRYAVLVTNGGLVGLTDDHRLWTKHGWRTAKEVANGKDSRCRHIKEIGFSRFSFIRVSFPIKERSKSSCLRCVRKGIRENTRKDQAGREKRESKNFLLSDLLSRMEKTGVLDDPCVWLLREEISKNEIADWWVEVGQVILLSRVLQSGSTLYDLSVEEDHSFIADGMVIHNSAEHCIDCVLLSSHSPFTKVNLPTTPRAGSTICRSNCKCRLEYKVGKLSKDERADAEEYANRRESSLIDMLRPPDPPPGMRVPTDVEASYIAQLRTVINHNRRIIATATNEAQRRAAILSRKQTNAELIEFVDRHSIHEAPLWSVDEVVTSADIGGVAEADIFRHGIDGESLDMLSERQLARLVDKFEKETGETFRKRYSKPDIKSEAEEPIKPERGKGGLATPVPQREEYQITGDGLEDTKWVLGRLLLAARGLNVQVGPYRDDFVDLVYAWVKGPDAVEVVKRLDELARKAKVPFVAVPVEIGRRRDARNPMLEREVPDR